MFELVEELDAGDVYGQMTEAIGGLQTAGNLLDELSESGAVLLAKVVDALAHGTARAEPQSGDVTLAPKLSIADGEIDWNQPADRVTDQIRGVTPEPGAYTTVDGARLKVIRAAVARDLLPLAPGEFGLVEKAVVVGTSTTPVELLTVHPAGRKAMDATAWWRGRQGNAEQATV